MAFADIFFVISGFLITSLLHKDIAGGTFSLADFLARRARRIVPALACVILVSFAAAYFIMSPEEMSEFGRSLASSALFGANFHFYGTTDYFALEAQERPLLHTWSLSIEEQFYLIWPLVLLLLVTRLPRNTAIMIIIGAMVASLVAFEVFASAEPTYAFYMPHCRAWALLIGALLALTVDQIELSQPVSEILGAFGLAGIVASTFLFSDTRPFPGVASLVATLGTAAIIVACNRKQPRGRTPVAVRASRLDRFDLLFALSLALADFQLRAAVVAGSTCRPHAVLDGAGERSDRLGVLALCRNAAEAAARSICLVHARGARLGTLPVNRDGGPRRGDQGGRRLGLAARRALPHHTRRSPRQRATTELRTASRRFLQLRATAGGRPVIRCRHFRRTRTRTISCRCLPFWPRRKTCPAGK